MQQSASLAGLDNPPSISSLRQLSDRLFDTHGNAHGDPQHPELLSHLYSFLFAFGCKWQRYFLPDVPFPVQQVPSTSDATSWLSSLQANLNEPQPQRKRSTCTRVLRDGDCTYLCKNCGFDDCTYLCSDCFKPELHEGHDVFFQVHTEGHVHGGGPLGGGPIPCACPDDDCFRAGSSFTCPTHGNRKESAPEQHNVPEELLAYLRASVAAMIEFSITALTDSTDFPVRPETPQDILMQIPPHEQRRTDRVRQERGAGPWSAVLWNDEKHSYEQVITQLCRALPGDMNRTKALEAASRVDAYGREVVHTGSDPVKLFTVSRVISNIQLSVSVTSARATFDESLAGVIWSVLSDLCSVSIITPDGHLVQPLRKIVGEELVRPWSNPRGDLSKQDELRVFKLLDFDLKLWKKARLQLRALYGQVSSLGGQVRKALTAEFFAVYRSLIPGILHLDREPEYSILSLGNQHLFVIPAVATELISEGPSCVAILFLTLWSFLTDQFEPTTKALVFPPDVGIKTLNMESDTFRHKRYSQLFLDIGCLLSSDDAKRAMVAGDGDFGDLFAAFCSVFVDMNPMTRATGTHVEYENERWVQAFNLTVYLAKACRQVGQCYQFATPDNLTQQITRLYREISRAKYFRTIVVDYANQSHEVIDYTVSRDPVSLHFPTGWFLAEVLKSIGKLSEKDMHDLSSTKQGAPSTEFGAWMRRHWQGHMPFLTAMEPAVRIHSLIAQIRANLWVRNGMGLRAQQMHYRESALRETTYEQDIFLFQATLAFADPDAVFVTFLERFELTDWLTQLSEPAAFEVLQMFALTEELMSLFISVLGEPASICCWSPEQSMRRDVIHALALGPCAHNELDKRLPDRSSDSVLFEKAVAEVSTFRAPMSSNDQGIYSLRKDVLPELDPWYYRYNRNQRNECVQTIKEGIPAEQLDNHVILPRPLKISAASFRPMIRAYSSSVLTEVLTQSLLRLIDAANNGVEVADTFLDTVIHVIVLCTINGEQAFKRKANEFSPTTPVPDTSLVSVLQNTLKYATKATQARISWCLRALGASPRSPQQADTMVSSDVKGADAKKMAAKARQAAIMAQFADAQKSFLDNIADEDDEDEDDDMGAQARAAEESAGTCIVCQEDLIYSGSTFGSLALIQASNVLRTYDASDPAALFADHLEAFSSPTISRSQPATSVGLRPGFPQQPKSGLHASSCGHLMHASCFEGYCRSVEVRQLTNPTVRHAEDLSRREFICPLCKSLGNVLLPVSKPGTPPSEDDLRADPVDLFGAWVEAMLADTDIESGKSGMWAQMQLQDPHRLQVFAARPALTGRAQPRDLVEARRYKMLHRIMQVVYPLLMEAHWDDEDGLTYYVPEELLTYTISAIETAHRNPSSSSPSSTGGVDERFMVIIRSLCSITPALSRLDGGHPASAVLASTLMPDHNGLQPSASQSLLNREPLTLLIEGSSAQPNHFSAIATVAFYTQVIRSLVAIGDMPEMAHVSNFDPTSEADMMAQDLVLFSKAMLERSRPMAAVAPQVQELLAKLDRQAVLAGRTIYSMSVPFARRALLLAEAMGRTTVPTLDRAGHCDILYFLDKVQVVRPSSVYTASAPDPSTRRDFQDWLHRWSQHYLNVLQQSGKKATCKIEFPGQYQLVDLPERYDELVRRVSQTACGRCHKIPSDPAICLLCGELVCSQSFCCMESDSGEPIHGECNTHMWKCGGSSGIWLLVRKCVILYLHASSGSFHSPPYLDQFGELDMGLKRHRPQFLHGPRIENLCSVWLNQNIPKIVARKMEGAIDFGGWTLM